MMQSLCPNITMTLSEMYPSFKTQLPDLWLPASHQLANSISSAISLTALDKVLKGIALDKVFSAFLSEATRQRQLTFLGGRLCAEQAVSQLGWPMISVPRSLKGVPIWPMGLCGSITHTQEAAYAIAAKYSEYNGVGIDSEWVVGDEGLNGIISMCCTKQELEAWFKPERNPLIATIIFSAKEAAYKAIYSIVMRYVDFTEFEVSEMYLDEGWLILSPTIGNRVSDIIHSIHVSFRIEGSERVCVHTVATVIST
ncbi:4'-phosphopantetheinyl transferase family protein [Psychrobacter sp.]|uniref:4'-phosphopantetheinyl transferase family protein n=1 Tax=Psychrobacter sp. TaxID=56811 RepID=UPI003C757CC5